MKVRMKRHGTYPSRIAERRARFARVGLSAAERGARRGGVDQASEPSGRGVSYQGGNRNAAGIERLVSDVRANPLHLHGFGQPDRALFSVGLAAGDRQAVDGRAFAFGYRRDDGARADDHRRAVPTRGRENRAPEQRGLAAVRAREKRMTDCVVAGASCLNILYGERDDLQPSSPAGRGYYF